MKAAKDSGATLNDSRIEKMPRGPMEMIRQRRGQAEGSN